MDNWREEFSNFKKQFVSEAKSDDIKDQRILAILDKNISNVSLTETIDVLSKRREVEAGGEHIISFPRVTYVAKNVVFVLSDFTFCYFIFYFICSLLSLISNIYILYTISLFEIIVSTFLTQFTCSN